MSEGGRLCNQDQGLSTKGLSRKSLSRELVNKGLKGLIK
jgi:hypothetical protein